MEREENIYLNEDGTINTSNMHYCIYTQANVFNDECNECLIKCGGDNKQPFHPQRDYII